MNAESASPLAAGTVPRSDLQRASGAASGDPVALRNLLERVTPRIRASAWNLCRDGHEAQDLAQEALLRITRPEVLRGYRGEGPLDGYLLSIAVRTMISAGRTHRARAARTTLTGEPEEHAGGREDPAGTMLSPAVRDALAALPERARAVVLLIAVGDLSLAEVAAALGMEVGTVKSTYSRARTVLRGRLADQRAG